MPEKRTSKRTTIILEDEERNYIDSLIREGKEQGIKPLISKMIDIYRSMMIYDWKYPGEYYFGISRVALVNVEFMSILLQYVPKEKRQEVGRKIGEVARISIETTLNLEAPDREKLRDVFKRLRVQGFGDFYLKDKYYIIRTPFINDQDVLGGFLEALFDVDLEARTSNPPFVFEIVG